MEISNFPSITLSENKEVIMGKLKPNLIDINDLITQTEAGKLRNVSRAAIHSLVQRGRMRSVNICGITFVFRSEVLVLKMHRTVRTNDEFLKDVIRVKRLIGHLPSSLEYQRHGRTPLSSICKRFGGWSKVLDAVRETIRPFEGS
jgi:hypothetical protein